MKVALVHDWLVAMRGGEKCLEGLCELYPAADLFTLVYSRARVSPLIRQMNLHISWVNRLPLAQRLYRYYLPLLPSAIETFDFSGYDMIISSSHCVAKGILPGRALHISYVHSPMRYIWDMHDIYFGSDASRLTRIGMALWRNYLQHWDVRSTGRVDYFIANSQNVAAKIKRLYGRDAAVIYPPVDMDRFYLGDDPQPYYLIVSALVPYKRVAIAIEAFNKLKLPLKIVGEGSLRKELENMAQPNVEFLGWVDDQALPALYASCQALIFPGEEDFGIVPLEAQASGRPVIAYGKGGALESISPWNSNHASARSATQPTGIFFQEPTPESLIEAVGVFEQKQREFQPVAIRHHAYRFSRERFNLEIREFIDARIQESEPKR